MDPRKNPSRATALPQDAGLEGRQAGEARRVSVAQQVAEAFRPMFDDRADEAHNEGAVLRVEQGLRDVLHQEQDDQAAQPIVTASQQQIRPLSDALDQGNHRPQLVIVNGEHFTALWPAERLAALNARQAVALHQQPSQIGHSGGRVPMQPLMQRLAELPLAGLPVQGARAEHIRRMHVQAAPSAKFEAPSAAIGSSITVSFALPKGVSHGTQRVPQAMLSSSDRDGRLPDAGPARQVGIEQHVAAPRRSNPAPVAPRVRRDPSYRHVSDEHWNVIDKAIAQAAASQQGYSKSRLQAHAYSLRRLANHFGERGQANDLTNHQSLVDHLDTFFPDYPDMKTALNVLRAYHEPDYSVADRPVPAKADAHLLEKAAGDSGLASSTRVIYSRSLRKFSAALNKQGQTITGLDHNERAKIAESLYPNDRYLSHALERIRKADSYALAKANLSLFDDRADVVPTNTEALVRIEQGLHGALQEGQNDQAASSFFNNPSTPAGRDNLNTSMSDAFANSGWAGVQAAAPPVLAASQQQIQPLPDALDQGAHRPPRWVATNNEHSTALWPAERLTALNTPQVVAFQQQPSQIGNSGGRVPMQPPMQQFGELPLAGIPVPGTGAEPIRRTQRAAPSARSEAPPAAIEDFIDLSSAVPDGFSHGTQRLPEAMLPLLNHHGLLPDADKPEWNFDIKGHGYTALTPEGGNAVWLVHRGAMREAAAAAVPARAPEPALPATQSDTYRGVPLVDLTTSSEAHIAALPSGSFNLPEGAVLGPDLLGDAHISRDYQLLAQSLQMHHPALAARTRLVDSLVSQQLRRHDRDPDPIVLSIYHQNDVAADFVFLPVNSGDPMAAAGNDGRNEHWSLLLVDRSDRDKAVAYHYDSIRRRDGLPYNDAPARELAARLDVTTVVTPAMALQNNGVDCGVFVVDGTRSLVERLANQDLPDPQRPLHLEALVPDRQALQNRLWQGRLPHEVASPAEVFGAAGSQVRHAVLQAQQARQVAPASFERHVSRTRHVQAELTSALERSNRVNSGGVIINNEHYTALLTPAKRQRTENPQILSTERQARAANTSSIRQDPDQARADLMTSYRSRERSDAGR